MCSNRYHNYCRARERERELCTKVPVEEVKAAGRDGAIPSGWFCLTGGIRAIERNKEGDGCIIPLIIPQQINGIYSYCLRRCCWMVATWYTTIDGSIRFSIAPLIVCEPPRIRRGRGGSAGKESSFFSVARVCLMFYLGADY